MILYDAIDYIYHLPQSAQSFCDNPAHKALEGYTAIVDDTFIIVFSGSNTLEDYKVNCNFFPKRIHEAFAHGGYVTHYLQVHTTLLKRFRQSNCSSMQLIGYSMGASVTSICAYMMHFENITTHTIAFEPLRVGALFFKRKTQQLDIVHTTYGNDIVTKLLRCFGYKHAGKEIHLGGKKHWWKYSIKDHPLENIASELLYVKEGI